MVTSTMSRLPDRRTVCGTDQLRQAVALGLADGHNSGASATLEKHHVARSVLQLKVDLVVQR